MDHPEGPDLQERYRIIRRDFRNLFCTIRGGGRGVPGDGARHRYAQGAGELRARRMRARDFEALPSIVIAGRHAETCSPSVIGLARRRKVLSRALVRGGEFMEEVSEREGPPCRWCGHMRRE